MIGIMGEGKSKGSGVTRCGGRESRAGGMVEPRSRSCSVWARCVESVKRVRERSAAVPSSSMSKEHEAAMMLALLRDVVYIRDRA